MPDNNNTETKIYKSHKERPNEEIILEPFNYVMSLKGKGIRQKFGRAYNEWFGIDENKYKNIGEYGEMGHNASLLIDDIEDGSDLRRGKPAAHIVYGTPKTITSANYVYFLIMEKVLNEFPPEQQEGALRIAIDQILEGHIGQGMDIYWRDKWICPTEEEYKKMILQKSGAFFTGSLELANFLKPDKEREKKIGKQIRRLGETMTMFFQIRDDYANLVSKVYAEAKTFAEDITEGKFSFPAIHCVHSSPKGKRLLEILKMKTTDPELKREAIRIMEESGSLEYTRKTCESLEKEFRDVVNEIREIMGYGGNALLEIAENYSLRHINTELEPKSISPGLSKAKVSGDCTTPTTTVIRDADNNNSKSIGTSEKRSMNILPLRFFLRKVKKIFRPRVFNEIAKRYRSHKKRPNEKIILEPFYYIMSLKGRHIRDKLTLGYSKSFNVPEDIVKGVFDMAEMGFNAVLLVDDIQDNSELRQGRPCAHVVYGLPATLNAANYIYFLLLEKMLDEYPPEYRMNAIKIYIDRVLESHIGQGMEIHYRENSICPTEEQYKQIVMQKDAFAYLPLEFTTLVNNDKELENMVIKQWYRIVEATILFGQIRDDYANLVSKVYEKAKTFAEDISEGKFNFPIIHCIQSSPNGKRVLEILKMKTTDPELKREALRIIEESGSLEYTRKTYQALDQEVRRLFDEVSDIGDRNITVDSILIRNFVKKRALRKKHELRKKEALFRKESSRIKEALYEIMDAYKIDNINTDREPNGYIMQGPFSEEVVLLQKKYEISEKNYKRLRKQVRK